MAALLPLRHHGRIPLVSYHTPTTAASLSTISSLSFRYGSFIKAISFYYLSQLLSFFLLFFSFFFSSFLSLTLSLSFGRSLFFVLLLQKKKFLFFSFSSFIIVRLRILLFVHCASKTPFFQLLVLLFFLSLAA